MKKKIGSEPEVMAEDYNEVGQVPKVKDVEAVQVDERELPKYIRYFAGAIILIMAAYHMIAAGYYGLPGIQHKYLQFYQSTHKCKNAHPDNILLRMSMEQLSRL